MVSLASIKATQRRRPPLAATPTSRPHGAVRTEMPLRAKLAIAALTAGEAAGTMSDFGETLNPKRVRPA